MEIVNKKVEDLRPYENNPRFNDDAVQYVAQSIKEFGFKVPIIVDKNNVIVAGHTRYKASMELGLKEVPCIVADDLSDEQIKAFRLADNKVGEVATWDYELLDEELNNILNIDMEEFGFSKMLSIEDIDSEELYPDEPIAKELDEANNYIVLEFNTETDWDKAQQVFGLKRVQTADKNENIRRHGIGRVIDGKEVMERLSNEN